ncbi:MAG: ComE operon protein 1 [Pelotomaculum sp. PtaU1.Bin035]|nr:MAG: ComE operon protein 1 [Pelotomaculum sp. PtaU1.Bin035]
MKKGMVVIHIIQLDRKQQLIILLLAGVILFGGGYRYAQIREQAAEESKPVLEAAGENKVKELKVHVAGSVARPGVYQLLQGARVIDAVNMAGPTGDAELDSLKLASPVTDGQTILVPLKASSEGSSFSASGSPNGVSALSPGGAGRNTVPQQGGPAGTAAIAGLVNINTADLSQLDTLPGIGPSLAQRIIQYRETNGPFKTIDELKNVSGIGDNRFKDLKDRITVY